MIQHKYLLLVTTDVRLAHELTSAARRFFVVHRVSDLHAAYAALTTQREWAANILDFSRAELCAVQGVRALRKANARTPLLVLERAADRELLNALHELNAELIVKPAQRLNVMSFLRRALVLSHVPHQSIAAWADEQARIHKLTPCEIQVMASVLGAEDRHDIIRRLGITENTLKVQVRSLLKKCGAPNLDALAHVGLRTALRPNGERGDQALEGDSS